MKDCVLIHSGDLHLGAGRQGGSAKREERFMVFEALLEACREKKADILLLAGDFLEQDALGEAELSRIKSMLQKACSEGLLIFISPGNHDPADPGSPYRREGFWPEGVKIFLEPETIAVKEAGLSLSGAGFRQIYQRRSFLDEIIEDYKKTEAEGRLEGCPLPILLCHAEIKQGAGGLYNPIDPADLAASPFRYAALGHVHRPDGELHSAGLCRFAYCGTPQGLSSRDEGERGARYLRFSGGHLSETYFFPLAKRLYRRVGCDLDGAEDADGAQEQIQAALDGARAEGGEGLVLEAELVLQGERGGHYIPDPDAIKRALSGEKDLVIRKITDESRPALDREKLEREVSLRGSFYREMKKKAETNEGERRALYEEALTLGLDAFRGELVN